MRVKKNPFFKESLETKFDDKESCEILNLTLTDLTFSKFRNLSSIVAHSGGLQVQEERAIRTLACGDSYDRIKRIMVGFSSDMSISRLKQYFADHPKAMVEMSHTSKAFISQDKDGNYKITDLKNGKAVLKVWREEDTEVPIVIEFIGTSP